MIKFDIDVDLDLSEFEDALSRKELKKAHIRATKRTIGNVRKKLRAEIPSELQTKNQKWLKYRIYAKEASMWFGLNDLPAEHFKVSKLGSGGYFINGKAYPKAFKVRNSYLAERIPFTRRITAIKISIEKQMDNILTKKVYPEIEEVYEKNLIADLDYRLSLK